MDSKLRDRLRGCLYGLAVGDALGAAVEFKSPGTFPAVTGYRKGPHPIPAGGWTDDTSMALALADSVSRVWDLNDQAREYLKWWKDGKYSVIDRCFDIGGTTSTALSRFEKGVDAYLSGPTESTSAGNGCIMRLAPVPVYGVAHQYQPSTIVVRCGQSSMPTHRAPACVSACRVLGAYLTSFLLGESVRDSVLDGDWRPMVSLRNGGLIHSAVAEVVAGSYRRKSPPDIRGSGYVVSCLEAALWAFHDAPDFRTAVLRAVNLGDDSDTTGAVCGQLAGAFWGESGIPAEWIQGLARREMIEDALTKLGVGKESSGEA